MKLSYFLFALLMMTTTVQAASIPLESCLTGLRGDSTRSFLQNLCPNVIGGRAVQDVTANGVTCRVKNGDKVGTFYCSILPDGEPIETQPTFDEVRDFSHPNHVAGCTATNVQPQEIASCVVSGLSATTAYEPYTIVDSNTVDTDGIVRGPSGFTTGTGVAPPPVETPTDLAQMGLYDSDNLECMRDSDGVTVITSCFQQMVDEAYAARQPIYLQPGTYMLDDTIHLLRRQNTNRNQGNIILGSYAGARPVIKLKSGSFTNAGSPQELLFFWNFRNIDYNNDGKLEKQISTCTLPPVADQSNIPGWPLGTSTPAAGSVPCVRDEFPANNFMQAIVNVDIVIESNNAGAIALDINGAQEAYVHDVSIDGSNGCYAGTTGLPARGMPTYNLEVDGCQYGVYLDNSAGVNIINSRFTNQTTLAMYSSTFVGNSLIGVEIVKANTPVIEAKGRSSTSDGSINMIDVDIEVTGGSCSSEAVFKNDAGNEGTQYFRNAYFTTPTGCNLIESGGQAPVTRSGAITHVSEYSYRNPTARGTSSKSLNVQTLVDSQKNGYVENVVKASVGSHPDVRAKHDFGVWPKIEAVGKCFVSDYGAVPNVDTLAVGQANATAFQDALDNCPSRHIMLDVGEWFIGSPGIVLPKDVIFQASNRLNTKIINQRDWTVTAPARNWLMRTVADATATTWVDNIKIEDPGKHPATNKRNMGSWNWQLGPNSKATNLHTSKSTANDIPGSGRWRGVIENGGAGWFLTGQLGNKSWTDHPDMRQFKVQNTNGPIRMYGPNWEHGRSLSGYFVEIGPNVKNFWAMGLKMEGSYPIWIHDGENIMFNGRGGHGKSSGGGGAAVPSQILIENVNPGLFSINMQYEASTSGKPQLLERDSKGDDVGSIDQDAGTALWKRGDIDDAALGNP